MSKEVQNIELNTAPDFTGFEAFEKEGFFFFQVADTAGSPILFSQPYASAEKRAAGMDAFQRNAVDARQYAKLETDGRYFFVVKAGNNKELARSRPFQSATERNKAMKEVQTAWETYSSKPIELVEEAHTPSNDNTPSHYRFSLSFYPEKDYGKLRGKIEFPLVKDDKESFEGIDLERIGRFIAERLPKLETKSHKQPAIKAQGNPINRPLEIFENGRPAPGQRVHPTENVEVQMALSGQDKAFWMGKSYKAILSFKGLEHRSETMSISKQGTFPQDAVLRIKAPTNNLETGLYRIIMHAEAEETESMPHEAVWEGSGLMLIS